MDLDMAAERLHRVMKDLVKRYQFRDRNRICCFGLSVSGCYILDELAENGDLTMQALAGRMFLSVSTMTRVVGQLVRRGYVGRRRDAADGRVVWVSITPKGKDVLRQVHDALIETQREILRPLTSREREAALRVLEQLTRAVGQWQTACGAGTQSPRSTQRAQREPAISAISAVNGSGILGSRLTAVHERSDRWRTRRIEVARSSRRCGSGTRRR
jgi:DNA-binding MarR family transcriptional regulator